MSTFRVLYTNFHPYYGGGHDTYILSLIKNKAIEAHVACPPSSTLYKKLLSMNYPLLHAIDFPGKLVNLPEIIQNTRKLLSVIADNSIDILHANGSSDQRIALYARAISGLKFKIIFTKHNNLGTKGFISKYRIKIFVDAIILVSDSILKANAFLLKKKRLYIIRNGVDTDKWLPGYSQCTKVINLVSIAGTQDDKGWHLLIAALQLFRKDERSRFRVKIAGKVPCQQKINEVFGESDIINNVIFTGYLDNPLPVVKNADIGFVLSTNIETISFACREMMSAGLPVIVSDYGGLTENITHNEDGWITPAGDVKAIARILSDILLLDNSALMKMKIAARKKAEISFSLDGMIRDTQRCYEEL